MFLFCSTSIFSLSRGSVYNLCRSICNFFGRTRRVYWSGSWSRDAVAILVLRRPDSLHHFSLRRPLHGDRCAERSVIRQWIHYSPLTRATCSHWFCWTCRRPSTLWTTEFCFVDCRFLMRCLQVRLLPFDSHLTAIRPRNEDSTLRPTCSGLPNCGLNKMSA